MQYNHEKLYDAGYLRSTAAGLKKAHQEVLKKLKTYKPGYLDAKVHALHYRIFEEDTDCLKCANCCKSISPAITDKDVHKLSRALLISPGEVVAKYLLTDKDGDYIFRRQPCPFLGEDNYCTVYENRPKACREYPHTNRKKFYQLLEITRRNIGVCPAVFRIVEEIRNE